MTGHYSPNQTACLLINSACMSACDLLCAVVRYLLRDYMLPVSHTAFSIAAWVEVLPSVDPAMMKRIPILRKPMQTDTSLTCWGWFHSAEFRFGAHGIGYLLTLLMLAGWKSKPHPETL